MWFHWEKDQKKFALGFSVPFSFFLFHNARFLRLSVCWWNRSFFCENVYLRGSENIIWCRETTTNRSFEAKRPFFQRSMTKKQNKCRVRGRERETEKKEKKHNKKHNSTCSCFFLLFSFAQEQLFMFQLFSNCLHSELSWSYCVFVSASQHEICINIDLFKNDTLKYCANLIFVDDICLLERMDVSHLFLQSRMQMGTVINLDLNMVN